MEKKLNDKLIVKSVSFSYSNNEISIKSTKDIIPDISILSNPSTRLHPKQVSLFNVIRFGLEICNNSYKILINSLSELTDKTNFDLLEFPILYSHIWNIINHSDLIHQIIKRGFPKTNFGDLFDEIEKTRKIRNSQQHIDERILDDLAFKDDFSIYGSLMWSKYYKETNEMIISSIYSGTITNKEKMSMKMENFIDNKKPNSTIQQIEFSYVTMVKKVLIKKSINLKQIMYDLEKISKIIITELKDIESIEKHQTDLMIRLKGNLK